METLSIMLPDWRGELSTMAEARGSTALLRVEVELQALNAFNLDQQEPIVLQVRSEPVIPLLPHVS